MTRAFLFLLSCGLKNRVLLRFNRLRRPKYLISAVAGLAYLYFVFLHRLFTSGSRIPREALMPGRDLIAMAETGFACLLLTAVVFHWFFSSGKKILFTEAEVQFLFPAPISRKTLIHYRIAKGQTGIALGTLISFLIFGRNRIFANAGFFFITLWFVYFFLYLYGIALLLEKKKRKRRAWGLAFILAAAISIAAWMRWFSLPVMDDHAVSPDLFAWVSKLVESGPAFYLLFPFRLLVRPAFALNPTQFALRLAPVVLIIAALYAWILSVEWSFEDAVLGRARGKKERSRSGAQLRVGKPRQPSLHLAPTGFAPVAIYWKNLLLAGAFSDRRVLQAIAFIVVLFFVVISASGRSVLTIAGSIAAGLACFLTVLGPIVFREDLRTDLKSIEQLKTYPIPGWGIVLGEVLGPATILAVLEWVLVLLAAWALPGFEKVSWKAQDRVFAGLGAMVLLPCLSVIGILIQNATVLVLPGWVQLGREHQQGIEAMGQRLISSIATVLFLLIAALPAAVLFGAAFFAAGRVLGLAVVPVASLLAALALLLEAGVGVYWLGHLFDRFDPSKELL